MPTRVQAGQIWIENSTGRQYLVSRTYIELFTAMAVLRATDDGESRRVPVLQRTSGQELDGFTLMSQSFASDVPNAGGI